MDAEAILDRLKAHGVIWLKHAFDPGRPSRKLLGGIVSDITTTMKSVNGTDFRTIVTLLEPSALKSERNVTIFHNNLMQLSKMEKGNIFICRDARANARFSNFTAAKTSPWAGFDVNSLEKTCEGNAHLLCDQTIKDILGLYQSWHKIAHPAPSSSRPLPPPPPPSITNTALTTTTNHQGQGRSKVGTGRRMIVTTENMQENTFIDYVGMVVSCDKPKQFRASPFVNIRLTDYTPNRRTIDLPYNEKKNPLVPIDMLINCALFDENAKDCPADLRFGDYVYIKNAICKLDPKGSMEMAVRHDSYKTTVKIWRLDQSDPHLTEIQRLRLAYENLRKRQHEDHQMREPHQRDEQLMPPTKKPKKPYRIRAGYSFIKDVLLDNYEVSHNLRVSVVDYKPKTIADMSVKFCDTCGEASNVEATQCKKCSNAVDKIVYRCLLQFKDAHGDILMATIYGTSEDPMFDKVPVVNLNENKAVCDQIAEYMNTLCPPDQEKGPMLDMCVKVFVYDNYLRCVIQNTKYQLDHGGL